MRYELSDQEWPPSADASEQAARRAPTAVEFSTASSHDQLSQLLAGIEHAGLNGGGRDAKDERAILDRLLLVVHQIENFAMVGREIAHCVAHKLVAALLLEGDFRIVGAVGHSRFNGLV